MRSEPKPQPQPHDKRGARGAARILKGPRRISLAHLLTSCITPTNAAHRSVLWYGLSPYFMSCKLPASAIRSKPSPNDTTASPTSCHFHLGTRQPVVLSVSTRNVLAAMKSVKPHRNHTTAETSYHGAYASAAVVSHSGGPTKCPSHVVTSVAPDSIAQRPKTLVLFRLSSHRCGMHRVLCRKLFALPQAAVDLGLWYAADLIAALAREWWAWGVEMGLNTRGAHREGGGSPRTGALCALQAWEFSKKRGLQRSVPS